MSQAATELLPGLLILLAVAKAAAVELKESGMLLEILAVLAAVGMPTIGYVLWGAGLNKLDDRYMDKVAFSKLKSEVSGEMAEVRGIVQTMMGKWETLDKKVDTLIIDERHRDAKMERIETQLNGLSDKLHKMELAQANGFSTLKDEIRAMVDRSKT